MATYSTSLAVTLQADAANSNTWGAVANGVFAQLDEAIGQFASIAITGDASLVITDGTASAGSSNQARKSLLILTGTPDAGFTLTMPEVQKGWVIYNNSDSTATITTSTGTTTVAIEANVFCSVYADGAGNVYQTSHKITEDGKQLAPTVSGTLAAENAVTVGGTLAVTGTTTLSGISYPTSDGADTQVLRTDGAGNLIFATVSGGGNVLGPASSIDGGTVAFDGTSGTLLKAGAPPIATKTTYLTSATWTKPAGARIVIVEAWGGGAGGGINEGGGGGGGYASMITPADALGSSVALTIGAGGAGGDPGGNGGDTTFGALATAPGGVASTSSSGGVSGGGQDGGINSTNFRDGSGGYSGGGGGSNSGAGGNAIKGGGGGGGTNGTAGGTSVDGGNGGAGAAVSETAGSGAVPGGGGGSAGSSGTAGAGGAGQITITVIG